MLPRVVFGPRSNTETTTSDNVSMATAMVAPGQPAVHFVAEAADPRSPLRVARSYFLSSGALVRNIFAGGAGQG